MKTALKLLFSAVFALTTASTSFASTTRLPAGDEQTQSSEQSTDASKFRKVIVDPRNQGHGVEYSIRNLDEMLQDLEHVDQMAKLSISHETAIDIVDRLATAIDLYVAVIGDTKLKQDPKVDYASKLEGGIYQAFITLLRQYGADPVDPKTREIPQRSVITKIVQELGIDVRAFTTAPKDAYGQSVYSPFEKLYRDQATQHLLVRLQEVARDSHTIDDGFDGDFSKIARKNMDESFVDPSLKSVNDRRAAQWFTVATYGVLAVVSFFVIVDYVGIVDGMVGGVGRTEMSQLITGIINFSVLSSVAMLKAATIRGQVRSMVLNLRSILQAADANGRITPMRNALATWVFRKQIDFDRELAAREQATGSFLGGAVRCARATAR